jgi:hypothetical protein
VSEGLPVRSSRPLCEPTGFQPVVLSWSDIDWIEGRLTVHSPKTEHHEGKDQRVIRLLPEIKDSLERVRVVDREGKSVFRKLQRQAVKSATGWKAVTLGTGFAKILKRAGITPWPRLFHNMRASCQTDLEQRFPTYVVCAGLGNSESVAKARDLQVLPEHYRSAPQSALQSPPVSEVPGRTSPPQTNEKPRVSAGSSSSRLGDEGFEPPASSL